MPCYRNLLAGDCVSILSGLNSHRGDFPRPPGTLLTIKLRRGSRRRGSAAVAQLP